jgi:hypothetical protein
MSTPPETITKTSPVETDLTEPSTIQTPVEPLHPSTPMEPTESLLTELLGMSNVSACVSDFGPG